MATPLMTGPQPTEKQIKHTLKSTHYSKPGSTARQVIGTLQSFPDLKPSVKEYVNPSTGKCADLMQLSGTIPVGIRDQMYNIPIRIWLQRGYPKERPVVYINPTADMAVATTVDYISHEGVVDLSRLILWKESKSNLCTLVQALRTKFSQQCPVYTITSTSRTSGTFSIPRSIPMSPTSCSSLPRPIKSEDAKTSYQKLSASALVLNDGTPDLVHLRIESDCKSRKIADLEREIESITLEMESYRAELHQERNSKQLRALKEELKMERLEKKNCEERASCMVSEMTHLREQVEELEVENDEMRQELTSAYAEIESYRLEISQLKEKYDCIQDDHDVSVKVLNAKLSSTMAEKMALEQNVAEQSNSVLKNGLDKAITELGITTARLSTTKAEKTILEEHYEEQILLSTARKNEIASLKKQQDSTITELGITTARLSLTRAEKRVAAEQERSKEMDSDVEHLKNELDATVTELGITTARLCTTRAENRILKEEGMQESNTGSALSSSKLEVQQLKHQLDSATTELGIATARLSTVRAEKKLLEEQCMEQSKALLLTKDKEGEILQLRTELEKSEKTHSEMIAQMANLEAEKEELLTAYNQQLVISSQIESRLSVEKESLLHHIMDTEGGLKIVKQEYHKKMKEMEAKLGVDIRDLQMQLSKITEEKQILLQEINEVLEDISESDELTVSLC